MNTKAPLYSAIFAIALLSACSTQGGEGPPAATASATTSPSIAVSLPPAPTQFSDGRESVNRDPCIVIGDELVESLGFDPSTRERDDYIFDTHSAIGCKFRHEEQDQFQLTVTTRTLSVNASNVTLDEFRSRERAGAKPMQINDREAITYTNQEAEACYVVVGTGYGTLSIRKSTAVTFSPEKPCDNIQEIAETIASSLPE